MEYLSNDPTYPAVVLGLACLIFLVLLKVTQQGKYLAYAAAALVFLLVWLGVERYWVTDEERIENVVYGLAAAVKDSDADRAADFLTPDCSLEITGDTRGPFMAPIYNRFPRGAVTRERLQEALAVVKFDLVRVSRLQTHVAPISRLGTAECVIRAIGTPMMATPPSGMGWSFGLREVEPKVWKITRISPGNLGT